MRRAWPPRGWRPLVCYRAGREAHGGVLPTRLAILVLSTPFANPRVGLPRRFALASIHGVRAAVAVAIPCPRAVTAALTPLLTPPVADSAAARRRAAD